MNGWLKKILHVETSMMRQTFSTHFVMIQGNP